MSQKNVIIPLIRKELYLKPEKETMEFSFVRYHLPDDQPGPAARFVSGIRRDTSQRIHLVYSQPGSGYVKRVILDLAEGGHMVELNQSMPRAVKGLKRAHRVHGGSVAAKRFLKEATISWKQHSSKA